MVRIATSTAQAGQKEGTMFPNLRNFVHDNETTIFLVVLIAGVLIGAAMVGVSHAVFVK